jgi:hypothetical protein
VASHTTSPLPDVVADKSAVVIQKVIGGRESSLNIGVAAGIRGLFVSAGFSLFENLSTG